MAEPLTRRKKKTQELYIRRDDVEADIDRAMAEPPDIRIARANIVSENSENYLHSETIIYLIRRGIQIGQLLGVILSRCRGNLQKNIANSVPQAAELRDDILGEFSEELAEYLFHKSEKLDYYEVNFKDAFACLRITALNKHLGRSNKLEEAAEEDESEGNIEGTPAHTQAFETQQFVAWKMDAVRLLKNMPQAEQDVVILCNVQGFTQEEAARQLAVTVETVRNRLKRAMIKLSSIKEDA